MWSTRNTPVNLTNTFDTIEVKSIYSAYDTCWSFYEWIVELLTVDTEKPGQYSTHRLTRNKAAPSEIIFAASICRTKLIRNQFEFSDINSLTYCSRNNIYVNCNVYSGRLPWVLPLRLQISQVCIKEPKKGGKWKEYYKSPTWNDDEQDVNQGSYVAPKSIAFLSP
jgi:hypothetical protein